MSATLTVPGRPVPFARAGANGSRRFTPPKQRAHKALVAEAAQAAGLQPIPKGTPVAVDLGFGYQRPQRPTYPVPLGRPDVDNLVKLVLDALNGLAYDDDAQVVEVTARKFYAAEPETRIAVRALEG